MTADQAPDVRADETPATPSLTFNFEQHHEPSQEILDEMHARRTHKEAPRATVHLADDQNMVANALVEALLTGSSGAWIFRNDESRLVELRREPTGEMRHRALTEPAARSALYRNALTVKGTSSACNGAKPGGGCECPAQPVSGDLMRTVMDRARHQARHLTGTRAYPILSPSGRIVTTPGYDADTATWLDVASDIVIPPNPTQDDAKGAAKSLLDLLEEFPLLDRKVDAANWIGLCLTLLVKSHVGRTPLVVVSGNGKGTGKSTLGHLPYIALTGKEPTAETSFPTEKAEQGKWISSVVNANFGLTLIDNIQAGTEVRGDALAGAITNGTTSSRRLGSTDSHMIIPVRTVFVATGNNIRAGEDMRRRVCVIHLSYAGNAARRSFSRDIYGYVREHRSEITSALLTILAAWQAAGEPEQEGRTLNGFERWHRVVGGSLRYAGVYGFMARMDAEQEESDIETDVWLEHFSWLESAFNHGPFSAKEVYDKLLDDAEFDEGSRPYPPGVTGQGNVPQRLGYAYRRILEVYLDGPDGGVMLQSAGLDRRNVRRYKVAHLNLAGAVEKGYRSEDEEAA